MLQSCLSSGPGLQHVVVQLVQQSSSEAQLDIPCKARAPVLAAADTRDVAGTVEQVKRCVDAGAEIVRITVQGKKEAEACKAIREALFKDRCWGAC